MIAIFGASTKGDLYKLYPIRTLTTLYDALGEPKGLGIHLSIQAILEGHPILFYKLYEEGEDLKAYHHGLSLIGEPRAIALPGLLDRPLLETARRLAPLILTERDFLDL